MLASKKRDSEDNTSKTNKKESIEEQLIRISLGVENATAELIFISQQLKKAVQNPKYAPPAHDSSDEEQDETADE